MIDVEEIVKKAYEESTTQIDRIIIDNKPYRIANVQYDDDCYENGNIFGTAIARSLEFEIENVVDLENKEFEYQAGIYIENEIKWISLGNFITQDIEPNDTTNITKIVSMDYMLKSNVEYDSKLDYSSGKITMLDVMEEACKQIDIELATKDFVNKDFIVDSNQFEKGTLIRQVFQAVAQMSGTFAKIRNDNKLYLITPKRKGLLVKEVHTMKVEELNKLPVEKLSACENSFYTNSYSELVLKRNTHPINLVSLGMSDVEGENITLRDEESIIKNGENSLVINDNPFAYTQEKREQLITALFDAIKGFEYTAYEMKGQAKFYLETGDEVAAIDKEGNVCLSFLLRFNYKSPNGLESTMEAPSIIKATVDYQNVPSALEIAKKTEIRVDKQEQKITELIEENAETSKKLTEHEQTIEGFKDTVSSVETKVNNAEEVANNAKETADSTKNNLEKNYPTTTEMNSAIEQSAGTITSEVNKTVSTAKQEAVNESNSNTDEKLKNYVIEEELGTKIEQNYEHIKYAWNKISEFLQLEIIDGTPVLAVRDEYKNLLMALNKTGQDFYKDNKVFGEMGVETINEDGINENYIAFSVKVNSNNEINDGMAWGFKDKDGKFNPILFVKNFYAGTEHSDDTYGQLVLNNSDLFLDGFNAGIIAGSVRMYGGDIISPGIIFEDINTGNQLFRVMPPNNLISGGENGYISILNSISFYENQGGSDSFKIGNGNDYCLMTDDGQLHVMGGMVLFGTSENRVNFSVYPYSTATINGNLSVDGNVYANNISSDRRLKKNIKNSNKNALDIIKQMKHRQFDMKKDNKHYEIGYIAQELEEIEPNFVLKREKTEEFEERYYINELPIIATITKAIQEQQEQIENIQKENEQKDEIIQDLLKRIETLERRA